MTRNVLFVAPFHRPFIAHRAQQSRYHKPKITPTLTAAGAGLLSAGCVGAAEFPRQRCSQHAARRRYEHLAKQKQREKSVSEDRRHTAKGWQERDRTATLPANHLSGTSSRIRQLFKNRLFQLDQTQSPRLSQCAAEEHRQNLLPALLLGYQEPPGALNLR